MAAVSSLLLHFVDCFHLSSSNPLTKVAFLIFVAWPCLCCSIRVSVPTRAACLFYTAISHCSKSTMGSQSNPKKNLSWSLECHSSVHQHDNHTHPYENVQAKGLLMQLSKGFSCYLISVFQLYQ